MTITERTLPFAMTITGEPLSEAQNVTWFTGYTNYVDKMYILYFTEKKGGEKLYMPNYSPLLYHNQPHFIIITILSLTYQGTILEYTTTTNLFLSH